MKIIKKLKIKIIYNNIIYNIIYNNLIFDLIFEVLPEQKTDLEQTSLRDSDQRGAVRGEGWESKLKEKITTN